MPPTARAAATAHLASCPSCRRYDRVIRKGVEALRSAPELKPRRPLSVADVRRRARADAVEHGRNGTRTAVRNTAAAPDL